MSDQTNNSKFASLSQIQKNYILGVLANRAMSNPSVYGLPRDGNLIIGDKVDVNKLIGDRTELDKLIDKALKLTEAQMQSISKNHELIKNWLAAHPNKTLDASKVSEILSAKKDVEMPIIESEIPKIPKPPQLTNQGPSEAELENQIAEAKKTPIENNASSLPEGRSMMGDFLDHQKVEVAFREDLDSVYGKSKLFGLTRIEGVQTAEWGSVRGMPAKKFTEFFTHNSEESELPAKLKEVLNSMPQHRKMALHLNELMKLAGGKMRPFDNENLEAFTRRLGGFVMTSHEAAAANAQLPKAA